MSNLKELQATAEGLKADRAKLVYWHDPEHPIYRKKVTRRGVVINNTEHELIFYPISSGDMERTRVFFVAWCNVISLVVLS